MKMIKGCPDAGGGRRQVNPILLLEVLVIRSIVRALNGTEEWRRQDDFSEQI